MLLFLFYSRIVYNYYLMFSRKPLDKHQIYGIIYTSKGKRITQTAEGEKQ